ncbi:MAG: hypothetical protein ABFS19_08225 [Thermodesulfobacteriota bacterium]
MKLKKLIVLPLAFSFLSLPVTFSGAALTVGGVVIAASISGCASPAQRARGRQDTRIENRTQDRYDRRRN